MKTIKIIDLLNKIANGEEVPKKIKYRDCIREYDDEDKDYIARNQGENEFYLFCNVLSAATGEKFKNCLNDEVEIIEEDKENKIEKIENKIEKIEKTFSLYFIDSKIDCNSKDEIDYFINELIKKVDEIIDVVNKGVNNELLKKVDEIIDVVSKG